LYHTLKTSVGERSTGRKLKLLKILWVKEDLLGREMLSNKDGGKGVKKEERLEKIKKKKIKLPPVPILPVMGRHEGKRDPLLTSAALLHGVK